MLKWAIIFALISLVAALFGFTGKLRLDEAFDLSDSIPVDSGDYDNQIVGWFGNTALQRAVAPLARRPTGRPGARPPRGRRSCAA